MTHITVTMLPSRSCGIVAEPSLGNAIGTFALKNTFGVKAVKRLTAGAMETDVLRGASDRNHELACEKITMKARGPQCGKGECTKYIERCHVWLVG
jgi:hypothetical protein